MKKIISIFLLILTITSFCLTAGKVFAIDTVFYSGNDILFYNPDDGTCSKTSISAAGDNAGNAYNYFVSKGLKAPQAAAIVGNLQQESGKTVEPKALNSIGAYGIAQWLGGRKDKLLQDPFYTGGAVDKSKELQVQLEFLWGELQSNEKGSYTALTGAPTTDPSELAIIFGESFERYGKGEEGHRGEYAADIFKQYGSTTTTTGVGACTNSGAGSFVYYSQEDPKWANHSYGAAGTVGPSGCGPTSMAMIVATFVDKSVTPIQTADLGVSAGAASESGTINGIMVKAAAEKWGFNYTDARNESIDAIMDAVKGGALVYMGGQGAAPYTSVGHLVVMRGVTDDGKIIIADPYRNAADVYPKETVDAGRGSTFIITKK